VTHEKKRFLIGTIITFAVSILVAFLIYLLKSFYDVGDKLDFNAHALRNVIDGLSISGLFGVLIYAIVRLSQAGAFDILAYSFKLVWYNTFRRNVRQTALPSSYAEYKELKHGDKEESVLFILIGSLPCLIVGIGLLIPYHLN